MFVSHVLAPVVSLGPGERIVVWTAGCSKRCAGCISPQWRNQLPEQDVDVDELAQMLLDTAREHGVHRLTVSGGDPLEQASELVKLLATIRCAYDDILVYTGFTLEELPQVIGADTWETLKSLIDVLIDGPYVDELNVPDCALRGSTNQRVIYLSDRPHDDYDQYLQQPVSFKTMSRTARLSPLVLPTVTTMNFLPRRYNTWQLISSANPGSARCSTLKG